MKELEKLRKENEELRAEIVKLVGELRNNICPTCNARLDDLGSGCKWCAKKHFDTEREIHKAWVKRANEAESKLNLKLDVIRKADSDLSLLWHRYNLRSVIEESPIHYLEFDKLLSDLRRESEWNKCSVCGKEHTANCNGGNCE